MIKSVLVLGRQPAIGLAELESLYGSDAVTPISTYLAGTTMDWMAIDFHRLGGSIKLAEVLGEVDSIDFRRIEKVLSSLLRSSAFTVPESGKFHLGVSAYDFSVSPEKLTALGLTLKKVLRGRGSSVRTVPNSATELSSAQVYHNKLFTQHGAELLLVAQGTTTLIARTRAVQDIDSYTLRDRGRPKRDARVGMLPPKLAQIIINLAAGPQPPSHTDIILDPFCGTGVLLQEALLMGYALYGSDIDARMIDYTRQNIDWATHTLRYNSEEIAPVDTQQLEMGDATSHRWQFPAGTTRVLVACETYLGRPFTTEPSPAILEQTVSDVNAILRKFLRNIHLQLPPHSRLCLAVPAWFVGRTPRHLPLTSQLSALGYRRISFSHTPSAEDLIYHREEQLVGRELLVLETV